MNKTAGAQFVNPRLKRFNDLYLEINAAYHEAALRLELSDSAFHVLYTVCCEGECFVSDLWVGGVSKQTINSALRKLEKEEVLYLEAEGKKKRVRLTSKGKALVSCTAEKIVRIENEIFSGWKPGEVSAYLDFTERYLKMFKEKTADL